MKALKTKVILSGIVLVFAFIATIGTTFAWFTVSTDTTVDSMELNVSAQDNLLILPVNDDYTYVTNSPGSSIATEYDLLTASNYQTAITNTDLYAAGYLFDNTDSENDYANPTGAWKLQPSTVINSTYTDFNGKAFNSINLDDRSLTLLEQPGNFNSPTGYYIHLKFWVLSQSDVPQIIEFDNLSITTSETNVQIRNAVRVSIWLDDNLHGGSTEGSAFIFGNDNDYDYEFTDGAFTSDDSGDTLQEVADALTIPGSSTLQADASAEVLGANSAVDRSTDLFTIQQNTPTLVNVVIYVEGWDIHANNNIIENSFDIAFGFKYGTTGLIT